MVSSYSSLTFVKVPGRHTSSVGREHLNFSALLLIPILQCESIPSVSLIHVFTISVHFAIYMLS